jgi:hypothetical protein
MHVLLAAFKLNPGRRHTANTQKLVRCSLLLKHPPFEIIRRCALLIALFNLDLIRLTETIAAELKDGQIVLRYNGISDDLARNLLEMAKTATNEVSVLLARPVVDPITIELSDDVQSPIVFPDQRLIRIPSNRVRGDAGGPPEIRGRGPAIVHELAHVVVPTRNSAWTGLLSEGLAVYLQERLGAPGDRSMPNMGRDLHQETNRIVGATGRFVPLRDPISDRTLSELNCVRQITCIQQGSFVRYLIETHGLAKFMTVYDGGTFEAAYGVAPERLEADWQGFIKTLIDRRRP